MRHTTRTGLRALGAVLIIAGVLGLFGLPPFGRRLEVPVPKRPIPTPTPSLPDEMFGRPLNHQRRPRSSTCPRTSTRGLRSSVALDPRAIAVKRLALTSLVATADLCGEWTVPSGKSARRYRCE